MNPSHSRQQFGQTHWSMVMRADATDAVDAHAALVQLCRRFWYPVYAYLRSFGHDPDTSREMTRAFLHHLLRHFSEGGRAQVQGRFRQYLLAHLGTFLAGDWSITAAQEVIPALNEPPPDLEARNQRDNTRAQSPEQAYQQSFALELLARTQARLRDEAGQTGHLDMFAELEPFLALDPTPPESEELARRLQMRPVTLVVAIKRLRQRFRELIDAELADTVASSEELLAEQQSLFAVLRDCG